MIKISWDENVNMQPKSNISTAKFQTLAKTMPGNISLKYCKNVSQLSISRKKLALADQQTWTTWIGFSMFINHPSKP